MEFEVEGSMASGDEEEVVPSLEFVMPNVEGGSAVGIPTLALDETCVGLDRSDNVRQERGWKLLMLLPRMLLHRPAQGGLIAKDKLRRFKDFVHGRWSHLIDDGRICAEQSSEASTRKSNMMMWNAEVLVHGRTVSRKAGIGRRGCWLQATNTRCTNCNADLHSPDRCRKISRGSGQVVDLSWMRNSSPRICDHSDAVQPAEHLRPLLNAPRFLHLLFRAESRAAAQVPQSTVDILK